MKYKYCPLCGRKLEMKNSWDEGYVPYCQFDDIMFFDLPKSCVVIAVIRNDEILLMKQSYIYKKSKVLVSGYVANGESLEEAAAREVFEETGIKIGNLRYAGSDSIVDKELLMITFISDYVEGEIKKSAEVEWVGWIKLDNAIEQMSEDIIGKKVVQKVLARGDLL